MIIATTAFAQGNLQFNRAFLVEHSFVVPINVLGPYSEISVTVPAGKVWKLESVMASVQNANATISTTLAVMLNNKNLYIAGTPTAFPVWLPEGTYTLRLTYTSNTGVANNVAYAGLSGIEFNVTP